MQLGAYLAGLAIENSMLGATHACANPLTARYGATHGVAIAMLLPSVVRWNAPLAADRYAELLRASRHTSDNEPGERLARRLEELAHAGGLSLGLEGAGVRRSDLVALAEEAAGEWTGQYNPRPFDSAGALEVYESAYEWRGEREK